MTKKRLTAEQVLDKLNDPQFLAEQAKRDADLEKRELEYRRAERPLIDELRSAGYAVESAWDFVNTSASYTRAIPILLAHLPKSYPGAIREGIARALGVPEAKVGWNLLIRLYREESEERVKDGLAVAIAGASDETVLGDVIALAKDTRNGPSRLLLLNAFERRSSDRRARAALMELGADPELKLEIQVILRRLKRKKRSAAPKRA
jgi:hypothetical protein